jgi:hypothetical protein
MGKALELAPPLATMEAVLLALWILLTWLLGRRGVTGEPFDDGPWWRRFCCTRSTSGWSSC